MSRIRRALLATFVMLLVMRAAAATEGTAPGTAGETAAPAATTTDGAREPWRTRLAIMGGGGAFRRDMGLANVAGGEARGGVAYQRVRGPLRWDIGLEAVYIRQQAVQTEPIETPVGRGEGQGIREATAGVLTAGIGYQALTSRVRPYIMVRAGLAAGWDETRVDLLVQTDSTTTPVGRLYGYDLDQTLLYQGPILTPAFTLEAGLEPLHRGRSVLEAGLQISAWPLNQTYSFGLLVRFGRELR